MSEQVHQIADNYRRKLFLELDELYRCASGSIIVENFPVFLFGCSQQNIGKMMSDTYYSQIQKKNVYNIIEETHASV